MTAWLTVISAVFQVVLLLLQSHATKEADAKQAKADQAKGISDAIASGDISRINSVVQQLRG
jgi:hypothetical protein